MVLGGVHYCVINWSDSSTVHMMIKKLHCSSHCKFASDTVHLWRINHNEICTACGYLKTIKDNLLGLHKWI